MAGLTSVPWIRYDPAYYEAGGHAFMPRKAGKENA